MTRSKKLVMDERNLAPDVPHSTLDDLFGPLELALDASDHQLQRERIAAEELATNPGYDATEMTCDHCKKSFPVSTWLFDIHVPTCEEKNAGKPTWTASLECPVCEKTGHRAAFMSHLGRTGPVECRKFWRALTVVEKKQVHPDYDLGRFEAALENDNAPSTEFENDNASSAESSQTLPYESNNVSAKNPTPFPDSTSQPHYSSNCRVCVFLRDENLSHHFPNCIERATEGRGLNNLDKETEVPLESTHTAVQEHHDTANGSPAEFNRDLQGFWEEDWAEMPRGHQVWRMCRARGRARALSEMRKAPYVDIGMVTLKGKKEE